MFNLFLLTLLTCNQVFELYQRLITNPTLNETQKKEIMKEIQKVVKSCPVIIKKWTTSLHKHQTSHIYGTIIKSTS
jgi:hypothetical protein